MRGDFQMEEHLLTAADSVYSAVRKLIIRKELVSGQKLSEIGLSEQLGVSRTPVREALRRLSNDGFVSIVPRSGVWVSSPTWREVENAYMVRGKLEGWAASIAARNMQPVLLARLAEQIALEEEVFRIRDLERYLEVNTAFHEIIAEASGNSVLAGFIGDILSKTFIYMVFVGRYFDFDTNPSLDEHKKILRAFETEDEQLCARLAEEHVATALRELDIRSQIAEEPLQHF
jgi:DNA-binding GntR family transcriptional regulator